MSSTAHSILRQHSRASFTPLDTCGTRSVRMVITMRTMPDVHQCMIANPLCVHEFDSLNAFHAAQVAVSVS
jgi:hypothetical protein